MGEIRCIHRKENMNQLISLGSPQDISCSQLGNKAFRLHQLKKLNYRVPEGFIVSGLNNLKWEEISKEIDENQFYAVRSSSNIEDLGENSFAGLYDTYLEVRGKQEVFEKIQRCFQGATNERALNYLKKNNLKFSAKTLEESFCVLVQKMVNAKISGVMFTLNPLTGKEEECLIEMCEGLGENLVSGRVNPSRYILDHRHQNLISKEVQSGSISSAKLKELSKIGREIQKHMGCPQDIEWCLDQEDNIWILQSRDITKVSWREDVDELTNADFKDGGVSARSCTPLMFSLYEASMSQSMPEYLSKIGLLKKKNTDQKWIYMFYSRVYWNAYLVKKCLFKIPGFEEKKFDEDLGIQKDYGPQGPVVVPLNFKTLLHALPVLFKLYQEFKNCEKEIQSYTSKFEIKDSKAQIYLQKSVNMDQEDFLSRLNWIFSDYYVSTEQTYFRVIYNNSNYQTEFKTFLKKIERKYHIEIDSVALMSDLDEVGHMAIQRDLEKLSQYWESDEYETQRTLFLKKHYHHGEAELDLMAPRWGEKPEVVDNMVEQLKKFPLNEKIKNNIFEEEKKRVFSLLGRGDKKSFERKLVRMRRFLVNRERLREISTRSYYIVRKFTLELGKRLESLGWIKSCDDVFFMKFDEILHLTQNFSCENIPLEEISYRKFIFESYSKFKAPNEFGKLIQGLAQNEASLSSNEANKFYGVAASKGVYRGRAVVIHSVHEGHLIQKGDILVTKFTDPGWTPLLGKVQGVVTEVGGVLSHAAVIGREYGIPAVLNVHNITHKIQTGDLIEVNSLDSSVQIFN